MTPILLAFFFCYVVRLVFVVGQGWIEAGANTPGFTFSAATVAGPLVMRGGAA